LRNASILLVLALSMGCITDRILIENDTRVDAAQFKRVEDTTARLRRLPFVEDVPADVMTVQQLREWFDQYADARKADLAKEDRFYHRTGILPPTISTAEAYKGFLADFVGGVYDDGRKRMILVSDYAWWSKVQQDAIGAVTGVDWAYEVFLVHELVHALQDQHFGLGEMLRGGVYDDNDDAAFVRKTILETEANVAGMAHFLGMDLEQLATRKAFFLFLRYNNLLNGPLLLALTGSTPSFFAKQALTQYELGLNFVERRLDIGGYDELSRAYLRAPGTPGALPESTEQLLYPRKMKGDRPVYFQRLEAAPTTLNGSSLILTNVFGALAFRHWFERIVGPLEGPAVSDGWGGDRYDLIDDGGHTILVWRTTWDSEDDAKEFLDIYSRGVTRRYGERAKEAERNDVVARFNIPAAPEEEKFIRTKRDEVVWIERRGKDVLIVDGVAPDSARAFTDEMWTHLIPVNAPVPDEAKLAQRAERLERHLTELPPKAPRPDLLGRLFLPSRTMSIRAGTGFGVIPRRRHRRCFSRRRR
jgi:hypothetical protein